MTSEWQPMETAPRDGTVIDVLCKSKSGIEVVVPDLKYGKAPMDKTKLILWGSQNFLSPYLDPIGWKAKPQEDSTQ
jgi:hypothetical protein